MAKTRALIPRGKRHAIARKIAQDLRVPINTMLAQLAPSSRRGYAGAIKRFLVWLSERLPEGANPLEAVSKPAIAAYRHHLLEESGLSPATVNKHLTAIRQLALEIRDAGLISPQRAQAIKRVKGVKIAGQRMGTWLDAEQAQALLDAPAINTKKGARDSAILALMLRCLLRRSEVASLTWGHVQEREGHRVLANILGKHGRTRTVPLPGDVWRAIKRWLEASGRELSEKDHLFVGMGKGDRLRGNPLDPEAIWYLVEGYVKRLGLPPISPHDLRRTGAKLIYNHNGNLGQLQMILGHASMKTTERYIKVELDLDSNTLDKSPLRAQ